MEIRYFRGKEIHRTRKLYEEVFQDSREYTEFFFKKAERECTAVAAVEEEQVIGELFLVPKSIRWDGRWEKVFYIYGVATAPKHRGKGIMKALMAQAEVCAYEENIPLLYLIPVDEKIYQPLHYRTVKKGGRKNYEFSGKDSKTMLQSIEVSDTSFCRELQMLEEAVYDRTAVLPLRDERYLAERLERVNLEDGEIRAFYGAGNGKLRGICITELQDKRPVIVDMVCREEDRELLIQSYMQARELSGIQVCEYPVMMKSLQEAFHIGSNINIYLNDEI